MSASSTKIACLLAALVAASSAAQGHHDGTSDCHGTVIEVTGTGYVILQADGTVLVLLESNGQEGPQCGRNGDTPLADGAGLPIGPGVPPIQPPKPPQLPKPALPAGGNVYIQGYGTNAPTASNPLGLACSPLTWDGTIAEITCTTPIVSAPPGTYWACNGPSVLAGGSGEGTVKGTITCAGYPAVSCTASVSASTLNPPWDDMCLNNSGLGTIAQLPVTCRAEVTNLGLASWFVNCEFPDP